MAQNYRLLAIDVDGTLLDSRNDLPEGNRAALHRAHEAGLKVCLCTGRSLAEARMVIDAIGLDLDAGVFVFGAVVSRLPSGETLHRTTIPQATADRVIDFFRGLGYPILALFDADEAGLDYQVIRGERNWAACEAWLAKAPARATPVEAWAPGPHEPVRIGVIDEANLVDETLGRVREAFPPGLLKANAIHAPNYGLHVVECFGPQVNKWHGLTQLARSLNISLREMAAIGDDVNDVEMIREAGLGIAMGNAIPAVKAVAKWQAPTNNDAGVAAAVEAILSGKRGKPKS